jgi:hypothetical protein
LNFDWLQLATKTPFTPISHYDSEGGIADRFGGIYGH